MRKDYYVILGIAADATLEQVKSAFRRRAMELHPDTSGFESGPFLEVQEAYGVLSDPERRRRYDRRTVPIVARRRPWGPTAEPMVRARPQAEPLRAADSVSGFREVPLADIFTRQSPSFDELFDRRWTNFDSVSRLKSEGLESLTVEVVLAAEEGQLGGARASEHPCACHLSRLRRQRRGGILRVLAMRRPRRAHDRVSGPRPVSIRHSRWLRRADSVEPVRH